MNKEVTSISTIIKKTQNNTNTTPACDGIKGGNKFTNQIKKIIMETTSFKSPKNRFMAQITYSQPLTEI